MASADIDENVDSNHYQHNKEYSLETESESNIDDQKDEILALQSIFENTERMNILSTPDDHTDMLKENDDTKQNICSGYQKTAQRKEYCLRLLVPVDIEGNVRVEATATKECTHLGTRVKPQYHRSVSGKRWHSSFEIGHLTPLILEVTLPPSYPSHSAPQFTLSCLWLSAEKLSILCKQLDDQWREAFGMPIIYSWIDWLQSSTFSFLKLSDTIILEPPGEDNCLGLCTERDPRAIPECSDIQEDMLTLIRYDNEQDCKDFKQNNHTCDICFDERPGSEFFRLKECYHHFCVGCLTGYCEMHVADGTVQQLSCPAEKCSESLPPGIIRAVLGDEAYGRWERLLFEKSLSTMGDVDWCPRCNMPVIRDEDDTLLLAYCTTCSYAFCTECHDSWHQGTKCQTIETNVPAEPKDSDEKSGNAEYAKHKQQNYLSKVTLHETTKPCPRCRVPIEKNFGCNKVRCTLCNQAMCWICGKAIKDYTHFNDDGSQCILFDIRVDAEQRPGPVRPPPRLANPEAERVQRVLLHDREARNRVVICKRCSRRNLKEQRNNHVKCWCCGANMCAMCQEMIAGIITAHYKAGMPCQHHS